MAKVEAFNSLCEGLPLAFELYFSHINSLSFEAEPDYE
jgi:hypothetical protein